MKDRFDLEDALMKVEQTSEDLDLITEMFLDREVASTQDEMSNVLIGLSALHRYRCEKTFSIFEEMVVNDQFKKEGEYEVKTLSKRLATEFNALQGDKDE